MKTTKATLRALAFGALTETLTPTASAQGITAEKLLAYHSSVGPGELPLPSRPIVVEKVERHHDEGLTMDLWNASGLFRHWSNDHSDKAVDSIDLVGQVKKVSFSFDREFVISSRISVESLNSVFRNDYEYGPDAGCGYRHVTALKVKIMRHLSWNVIESVWVIPLFGPGHGIDLERSFNTAITFRW